MANFSRKKISLKTCFSVRCATVLYIVIVFHRFISDLFFVPILCTLLQYSSISGEDSEIQVSVMYPHRRLTYACPQNSTTSLVENTSTRQSAANYNPDAVKLILTIVCASVVNWNWSPSQSDKEFNELRECRGV